MRILFSYHKYSEYIISKLYFSIYNIGYQTVAHNQYLISVLRFIIFTEAYPRFQKYYAGLRGLSTNIPDVVHSQLDNQKPLNNTLIHMGKSYKYSRRLNFLLIFFFIFNPFISAQPNIDSLWHAWNNKKNPDTLRTQAISIIIEKDFLYSDPDSAFALAQLMFEFSSEKKLQKDIAEALRIQGVTYVMRRDLENALEYFEKSLLINQEISYKPGIAKSLNNIGIIYMYKGDADGALEYYEQSFELFREINDKQGMADPLNAIGALHFRRGEYDLALDYWQQSLELYTDISDQRGMAKTMNNMGLIYRNEGDFTKAIDNYERCLLIYEEISDKQGMTNTLSNLGTIYLYLGYYPRALDHFRKSLLIKEEISDKNGMANALSNIGIIYAKQSEPSKAKEYYERSYEIYEEIADKNGMARILTNLGLIYEDLKEYNKAMEYYYRSLEIKEELSDKEGIANILNNIGLVHMHQGNYILAEHYYQRSLEINIEISDERDIANNYINLGISKNRQGEYKKAISWCNKGLAIADKISIIETQKLACECLYDATKAIGNTDKALVYHERVMIAEDSLQAEETAKKLQHLEFSRQMKADSIKREEEKRQTLLAHEAEVRTKTRVRNISILAGILLLFGLVLLYRRIIFVRRAKQAVEKDKARSDDLLLNIFPSDIAEELKEKGKADPRKFEDISIIFTDFKEFTQISEQLGAEKLVGEINSCFQNFDAICKKYGIEKIKTIGDAYMAAGGLPTQSSDSVKNTVLAGIDMADCMINMQKRYIADGKTPFEMRVGIHTGPVVAGIVGTSKFQYDIWGDTVNTASRIENAGEVGKVNISKTTYDHIKDDRDFVFQPRGYINVKGKGEIEMWFVDKVV